MEFLNKIVSFVQELNKKEFEQYLAIFLGAIALIVAGILYVSYTKSNDLLIQMKKLETLAKQADQIVAMNEKMKENEQRYKNLMEQNKDFTLLSAFEKMIGDLGMSPEPGWMARTDTINDKLDEVSLPTTFRGQTTDRLVKFLEAIDKKELIYVKALSIKNMGNKQISFDITLATNKYKAGME